MSATGIRLDGKLCLVTGGAGYLGSAMSAALAEAGAHVFIAGRDAAKAERLARELNARGLSAEGLAADLTKATDIAALVARVGARSGRLDVLVNNAYAGKPGVMAASKPADYHAAYDITVVAAAELVNAAGDLLGAAARAGGDASVVNISSMYGTQSPDPRVYGDSGMDSPPWYGAAKAALLQYTRYAARHLAPQGIRVNAVSPGAFPPAAVCERDPAFCANLVKKIALGRLGRPEDVAGAVLFLAGPGARFITGTNLPVDGGWMG